MPPLGPPLRRLGFTLPLSLVVTFLLLAAFTFSPAMAATQGSSELSVTATRRLSVMGQAVGLVVEGPSSLLAPPAQPAAPAEPTDPTTPADTATAPQVVVRLYGPLTLEDMERPVQQLPAPRLLNPLMKPGPAGQTAASPEDTVVMAVVPSEALTQPGAYLAIVAYSSGEVSLAEGSAWFGRMVIEREPLELACVWPLTQGVHRDAEGVFFDTWLEEALQLEQVEPGPSAAAHAPGRMWDLLDLAEVLPDWGFTLAVEPILLTQLAEMADGYSRVDPADPAGAVQEIDPDDERAINAALFLERLKAATTSGQIGVAAAPYAGPSASVLATEEWSDGVGQMRVGRQVVQQVLPLVAPVTGAYSPDLDLTTKALSSYSGASIDHLLVDAVVADDLDEPVAEGVVTVRARDTENERLTLILADSRLRSLMAAPWDAGLFCAGLAARATTPAQALVLTPAAAEPVPPLAYMESLIEAFAAIEWLESTTLNDLVYSHPPGSRPVLLDRAPGPISSYVGLSLLDSVATAHAAVEALSASAGLSASGVQEAQLLLYTAESGWWSRPQTSPQAASVGLDYALRAQTLAEGELQKVRVSGVDGTTVTGKDGVVVLRLENQAEYPMSAQVDLGGTGLTFPEGAALAVELKPGVTELPVAVKQGASPHSLEVRLLAGSRVADEWSGSVDFVTVRSFLPWVLVGLLLIAVVVGLVLPRRSRRDRSRPAR